MAKKAKRKKAKTSKKTKSISMTKLLDKASGDRSLFRRLMKDPEATLAREGLSVSADNLRKLGRMRKLIKKRIPIKLKPGATAKALRQLHIPQNTDWIVDWRREWQYKRFPGGIPGQIKLPK